MPAAVAVPAIVAAVGGTISAVMGNKAAKAQAAQADRTADMSEYQYQQTRDDQLKLYEQQREDTKDYRAAGTQSLAELMRGTAAGGEFTKNYERGEFAADPGRLYRLSQGEQGINRAAAARGGWNSGATLKALARFNSDQASQEYGAWDARENNRQSQFNQNREFRRNNLASLAGIGQTATTATSNASANAFGQIANAGQNNVQQQAMANQASGEARASGYVGAANAIGGGIKSIYDNYQQSQYLKQGGYDNWANSNAGVSRSTGLSAQDLSTGF